MFHMAIGFQVCMPASDEEDVDQSPSAQGVTTWKLQNVTPGAWDKFRREVNTSATTGIAKVTSVDLEGRSAIEVQGFVNGVVDALGKMIGKAASVAGIVQKVSGGRGKRKSRPALQSSVIQRLLHKFVVSHVEIRAFRAQTLLRQHMEQRESAEALDEVRKSPSQLYKDIRSIMRRVQPSQPQPRQILSPTMGSDGQPVLSQNKEEFQRFSTDAWTPIFSKISDKKCSRRMRKAREQLPDLRTKNETYSSKDSTPCHLACNAPFTIIELAKVMGSAKLGTAAGTDSYAYEFWCALAPNKWRDIAAETATGASVPAACSLLLVLLNILWCRHLLPKTWRTAVLKMLYKNGDARDSTNWRPISLINCVAKIYSSLVLTRIQKVFEHKGKGASTCFAQRAFKAGTGCTENLHALHVKLLEAQRQGRDIGLIFFDIKKAYDSVDRALMLKVLDKKGVRGNAWFALETLFNKSLACISITPQSEGAKPIRTTRGLRQGDPMSPELFNIFVDVILETLNSEASGLTEPVTFGRAKIRQPGQSFCDDLIGIAHGNPREDLQRIVTIVCNLYQELGLEVNTKPSKTAAILFPFSRKSAKDWIVPTYKLTAPHFGFISFVSKYKYLGAMIDSELWAPDASHAPFYSFRKQRQGLAMHSLALLTSYGGKRGGFHPDLRVNLYLTFIRVTLLYAVELWAIDKTEKVVSTWAAVPEPKFCSGPCQFERRALGVLMGYRDQWPPVSMPACNEWYRDFGISSMRAEILQAVLRMAHRRYLGTLAPDGVLMMDSDDVWAGKAWCAIQGIIRQKRASAWILTPLRALVKGNWMTIVDEAQRKVKGLQVLRAAQRAIQRWDVQRVPSGSQRESQHFELWEFEVGNHRRLMRPVQARYLAATNMNSALVQAIVDIRHGYYLPRDKHTCPLCSDEAIDNVPLHWGDNCTHVGVVHARQEWKAATKGLVNVEQVDVSIAKYLCVGAVPFAWLQRSRKRTRTPQKTREFDPSNWLKAAGTFCGSVAKCLKTVKVRESQ